MGVTCVFFVPSLRTTPASPLRCWRPLFFAGSTMAFTASARTFTPSYSVVFVQTPLASRASQCGIFDLRQLLHAVVHRREEIRLQGLGDERLVRDGAVLRAPARVRLRGALRALVRALHGRAPVEVERVEEVDEEEVRVAVVERLRERLGGLEEVELLEREERAVVAAADRVLERGAVAEVQDVAVGVGEGRRGAHERLGGVEEVARGSCASCRSSCRPRGRRAGGRRRRRG